MMLRLPVTRFFMLALLAVAPALSSCANYSSKPLYNPNYHTVAVHVFGNKTFRREREQWLSEALDKAIERRTPYKLVSEEKADTVLTGEIVEIQEDVLTRRTGTLLPRETQLTVAVNFIWKDRSGHLLVERKNFNRSSTEIPQIGERVEDVERLSIERLAEAIVDQMQINDW